MRIRAGPTSWRGQGCKSEVQGDVLALFLHDIESPEGTETVVGLEGTRSLRPSLCRYAATGAAATALQAARKPSP